MSDGDNVTRRTVLSRGLTTTVALGVGTAAFAGPAAATECPRTPGYWMNHRWPDEGATECEGLVRGETAGSGCRWWNVNERLDEFSIDLFFSSPDMGRKFLAEPKRGDKGQILAFHLVATTLNFQRLDSDGCVYTPVRDVDGDDQKESVGEIKALALNWLKKSGWSENNPVRKWDVTGATVSDGEVLKDALDDFNNNRLGLDCEGCDGDSDGGPPTGRGRGRKRGR
jgi:hypothetical protein